MLVVVWKKPPRQRGISIARALGALRQRDTAFFCLREVRNAVLE